MYRLSRLLLLALLIMSYDNDGVAQSSAENRIDRASADAPIERAKGYLRIGDEEFDLDLVVCIRGMLPSATASDRQKRAGYPTLTIKAFPESMGGRAGNTASAVIEKDGVAEHWKFKSGNVRSKDGVFYANGFLEGAQMVEQPDGTLKPAPYGSEGVKPFASRIDCS